MFMVLLVTLYTSRIVLNQLGVEDYGIYTVVGSVVIFLSILQGSLNSATSRFIVFELGAGDKRRVKEVYSMAINCHLIMTVFVFLAIELIGGWFVNNHLNINPERITAANWVFHFSLLTLCCNIMLSPFSANVVAHEKMDFYAVAGIIEVLLQLFIAFYLSATPYDKLITYGVLMFGISAIILLMNIVYCKLRLKDTSYILFWDSRRIKQFASYSGWSLLVSGADVACQQSLSIFFNWFIGVVGNTALGISNRVNSGFNMFVSNFSTAYRPQIIKSYASGDNEYFMKLLFSASKISYFLIFVVATPIICNIEFVLDLWLGRGVYPPMAKDFVIPIFIYYAFDSFQRPLWQAVHATGNIKTHQIIIGCIMIVTIPLAYMAFYMGANGFMVLMIWAGTNGCCAFARTLYLRTLIQLDLLSYFKDVAVKIVVLTLMVMPAPYFLAHYMGACWLSFVVSTLLSIVLSICMGYFYLLSPLERSIVKNVPVIGKILNRNHK